MYAQSGSTIARDNADLSSVISWLYNACPLGSGWNYRFNAVTIGKVSGMCETDGEPIYNGYNGKPARSTSWNVTADSIPK